MRNLKLRKMAGKVGYKRKGYNWGKSVKRFKKTGYFKTVAQGSGHDAGYKWAQAKEIDPTSRVRKYSKNSPSFDEGVYAYKNNRRQESKMGAMASKVKSG